MRKIVVAVALILMLATAAYAGDIFRYVDSDGTISFTDDVKRIPPAYKDAAEEVVLEGEFKNTVTFVTVPRLFPGVVASELLTTVESCDGAITITSERKQFGDFNRTVYSVHDECGKLVSETFSQPEVDIER